MSSTLRRGTNLAHIKWENRAVVLETLWRHQPLSRKDLTEQTHLTAATLTNIIAELIAAGLVREIGLGEQALGRRPMLLTFVPEQHVLIGANVSRTELSIGVFDLLLNVRHLLVRPIGFRQGSAPDTLIALIRQAMAESGCDPARVLGIGISAPGPLSLEQGVIYAPPNFSEWSDLPLGRLVSETLHLPVWLENDGNANALAEHWLGVGRSYHTFLYVECHSGLGSGLILNGRLHTGSAGIATEIGHTSIDRHGPRCACGNYGCVELYSSGAAIVERLRQARRDGASTLVTRVAGLDLADLTFDQVLDAVLQGDPLARRLVEEACRALGTGLVNAINLIDPQAVIVGHKLNRLGELALAPIREVILAQAIPQAAARAQILLSQRPEPVAVTGAACRALSGLLQHPDLLLQQAATLRAAP